jgi:folate-binding protein YgfZ
MATAQTLESGKELAICRFDGPDAQTFLQGYLTCDLNQLSAQQALPAALCNLKGRVIANGWALPTAALDGDSEPSEGVALLCHGTVADALLAALEKYLVFSKTKASRADAPFALASAPESTPATPTAPIELGAGSWLAPGATAQSDTATAFWQRLCEARRVLVTHDTAERFLPQMLGLEQWGAVDFDKGCYLGQEVVARAQHRGAVKRQLALLQLAPVAAEGATESAPPAPDGQLSIDGKAVGEAVQQAGDYLLAVLRAPFPAPSTPLQLAAKGQAVTAFVLA